MAALNMCARKTQTFLRFLTVKQNNRILLTPINIPLYFSTNSLSRNLINVPCRHLRKTFSSTPVSRLAPARACVRSGSAALCLQWQRPRLYSTTQSKDTVTNITDDILQSKSNTDEKSSESKSNKEEKKEEKKDPWYSGKNAWKLGMLSLFGSSILICGNLVMIWGAPNTDENGKEIEDEFTSLPTWHAYTMRAKQEAHFFKKMIEEPSFKKLLPDPLQDPWFQPPYTLVLEMTGILVHPDWTLGTGWRFKKRPGIQYFLQQVASPLYEIVIFTHEQGMTAFPIVDGLDPNHHIMYRLFRDATRYMDTAHVKDLDNLNRDLSKVIIVDCDPKAIQKHPRNALLLKKWGGADGDTTLIDLAAFLKTVATSGVEDVRPVLEYYGQFDDPLQSFKDNQKRLQGEQERMTSAADQQDKTLTGFGRSFWKR